MTTSTPKEPARAKASFPRWGAPITIALGAFSLGIFTCTLTLHGDHAGPARTEGAPDDLAPLTVPPRRLPVRPEAVRPLLGEQIVFTGTCDASGAVPLDRNTFAVADDEDNLIRIYDVRTGGPPLRTMDVSPGFPARPEADIEAATVLGNEAFWLGSHGRGKSGQLRSERLVLLATNIPTLEGELRMVGAPFQGLVAALTAHEEYAPFDLPGASAQSATSVGGLNFEGMTSTDRGSLLIGFRSPVPQGKALIAELLNPSAVLWGEVPSFAAPILLTLGAQGVRSLSSWRGDFLIIAGPRDYGTSKLYRWRGPGVPASPIDIDFTGLNPEAFFTPEDRDEILLISDDGTNLVDGTPCKDLDDPEQKYFRAVWVKLTAARVN